MLFRSANCTVVVQATRVLSNGVKFANSAYRQIAVMTGTAYNGGTTDIKTEWLAAFGTTLTNTPVQNIKFRFVAINKNTGQASTLFNAEYEVT